MWTMSFLMMDYNAITPYCVCVREAYAVQLMWNWIALKKVNKVNIIP